MQAQFKRSTILLIVVFLLLSGLRFVSLGADPPKTLSISMGYMSDPGGYVHNARNKVLYDRWETDKWNFMYINPIPHYMSYILFRLLGPGIASMNLVPALFSVLTLLTVFWILKYSFDRNFAILGLILLGTNYLYGMFSPVAVRNLPMIFFALLSLLFLIKASLKFKSAYFLAGAMCFLSFAAKGNFLLIFPAIFLGTMFYVYFQSPNRIKSSLQFSLYFLLGLGTLLLLWLIFIYMPHKEAFLPYGASNKFWLTPHDHEATVISFLWDLLKNFWHRPLYFFMNMPVLTCLSSLCLLGFAYRFVVSPRKIRLVTWIAAIWTATNMVYFSIIQYRAGRHLFPLVLPILFLAIDLLYDFFQTKAIRKPERQPALLFIFLFFWLIFAVSSVIIFLSRPARLQMHSRFYLTLGLSLGGAVLLYMLCKIWPARLQFNLTKFFKVGLISFLVGFSLIFNFKPYAQWLTSARYDRRDISRDLGKAFERMNIGGLVSMVLVLENQHAAHAYSTGYINRGLDFIEKYGITHALLTTHAEEIRNYQTDFPQHMSKAKVLARYPLWQTYVVLYDLNPTAVPPTAKKQTAYVYEGETFYSQNGIPRFDGKASGNLAFLAEKSQQGFTLELPAGQFPQGEYRVVFRLKLGSTPRLLSDRIARMDIVEKQRQKVFSRQEIHGQDFNSPGTYQDFELDLTLRKTEELTLRFHSTGKAELWFDLVTIQPKQN